MIEDIRQALTTASTATGLHMTLVAGDDLLHLHGAHLLGYQFQSHRTCRACDIGFGPRCIEHCRTWCNNHLKKNGKPLATRCWKGLREIATPIRWKDHHMASLYAGTWRQTRQPASARELGEEWRHSWKQLPIWQDEFFAHWSPFLTIFADGLAEALAPIVFEGCRGSDLAVRLDCWFRLHTTSSITLGSLAKDLGLSVSRTGAVVREHFDMPFAMVIRKRRIDMAQDLLRNTPLRVSQVAAQVGYDDPAYFSRVFQETVGQSPRGWRKTKT